MWIRSQDKTMLINADLVYTGAKKDFNNRRIYCNYNSATTILLGKYATEERAMEVLDEIQERIIQVKAAKTGWFESKGVFVYEMPEE